MVHDIVIEAETLEQARAQARQEVHDDLAILSEKVIADGKPHSVRGEADTREAAFTKAQSRVPATAQVVTKKVIAAPEERSVTAEAFTEHEATQRFMTSTTVVKNVRQIEVGRKGFLNFGKKPNRYEICIFQQAVVELIYTEKAKISVTIGPRPATPASVSRSSFGRYPQSGICDVCNASVGPNEAYLVPVSIFYSSPKYRQWLSSGPMSLMINMSGGADAFLRLAQSNDKTPYSAVCPDCVHLFE